MNGQQWPAELPAVRWPPGMMGAKADSACAIEGRRSAGPDVAGTGPPVACIGMCWPSAQTAYLGLPVPKHCLALEHIGGGDSTWACPYCPVEVVMHCCALGLHVNTQI